MFLLILCSIKIERLLFLKFLKILAFFDSYSWPFNKSEGKIKVISVISVIMPSIWNVFIKFGWHDEKLTPNLDGLITGWTKKEFKRVSIIWNSTEIFCLLEIDYIIKNCWFYNLKKSLILGYSQRDCKTTRS